MKFTLIIASFLLVQTANCQINDKLLDSFIADSNFCKKIIGNCNSCDTIFIVDTAGYFTPNIRTINNIKIVITKQHDKKMPFPPTDQELKKWRCNNLFIHSLTRTNNRKYRISYFHSPTSGAGFIEFTVRQNKITKTGSQYGQL